MNLRRYVKVNKLIFIGIIFLILSLCFFIFNKFIYTYLFFIVGLVFILLFGFFKLFDYCDDAFEVGSLC